MVHWPLSSSLIDQELIPDSRGSESDKYFRVTTGLLANKTHLLGPANNQSMRGPCWSMHISMWDHVACTCHTHRV